MELQVGAKVLLKNSDGKCLLMRRSAYEDAFQGKWDFPGGRINSETPLITNLEREVLEETGLSVLKSPRLVAAQDIFIPEQERHVVRLTYVARGGGDPRLSEEHSEFKWFSFDEMRQLTNLDKYLQELMEDGTISEATHE